MDKSKPWKVFDIHSWWLSERSELVAEFATEAEAFGLVDNNPTLYSPVIVRVA